MDQVIEGAEPDSDRLERQQIAGPAARRASAVVAYLTGALIVVLMLLTAVDVLKRSLGDGGVRGTIEITEVVLVIAVYLGMIGAEISGSHIRTSVLIDRLPTRAGGALASIALLIGNVIVALMAFETTLRAWQSVDVGEYRFGLLEVPVWPARIAIALGLIGLLAALILRLIAEARATRDDERISLEEQSLL